MSAPAAHTRLATLAAVVLSIGIVIADAEPLAIEVASAEASVEPRTGQPVVTLRLSDAATKLLAQITQQNVGHILQLRIDGRL